jgi:hypothetical protein
MTTASEMLSQLKEVSKNLKKAAVWNGSGLAVDASTDHFIFELLCYFHITLAAQDNFDIHIAGHIIPDGSGKLKAKWPKSPGEKKNFSYFEIVSKTDGDTVFKLCPGINIIDKHGKKRALDINLLLGTCSDEPSFENLLACWDAKHTALESNRLPDKEVADFIFTFQQLDSPNPPASWRNYISIPIYIKSGLLTNSEPSTEPDETLDEYNMYETNHFPDAPITRPIKS